MINDRAQSTGILTFAFRLFDNSNGKPMQGFKLHFAGQPFYELSFNLETSVNIIINSVLSQCNDTYPNRYINTIQMKHGVEALHGDP